MTRSHKANERDHVGLANGTADPDQHLPRYFGKSGHVDADPKGVKKSGGGKGNWYADIPLSLASSLRLRNASHAGSGHLLIQCKSC